LEIVASASRVREKGRWSGLIIKKNEHQVRWFSLAPEAERKVMWVAYDIVDGR